MIEFIPASKLFKTNDTAFRTRLYFLVFKFRYATILRKGGFEPNMCKICIDTEAMLNMAKISPTSKRAFVFRERVRAAWDVHKKNKEIHEQLASIQERSQRRGYVSTNLNSDMRFAEHKIIADPLRISGDELLAHYLGVAPISDEKLFAAI